MTAHSGDDLLRQTLRTTAILVGACVVFVGTLSAAAVVVTNRAVGPRTESVEVEPAPVPAATGAGPSAKKPLSI